MNRQNQAFNDKVTQSLQLLKHPLDFFRADPFNLLGLSADNHHLDVVLADLLLHSLLQRTQSQLLRIFQ